MAPRNGPINATSRAAAESEYPSQRVLSVAGSEPPQYDLKKIGKNPARTVVENAEFAQS
jgi:hypothetical protein